MSIVLEHLTKLYDGHAVVRDLSLEVAEGELCVLLGPSGSGKTTLLRLLAGLAEPDAGRVLMRGRDVTRVPPQRRGVGFVFQHYALFRHMTVAENVEFALRVRGVEREARRARRDELLDLVGLAGFGPRRPAQLSGGQQQRVALARALAHAPDLLLLDEPFGALDARIRAELRATFRRIQRELRVTAMFVTHDQEEAFELADRIAVLHEGRLLELGTPRELYLHPGTEFTATFLGSANLIVGDGDAAARIGGAATASRVQLLFRPEDVAVKDTPEALHWPPLGRAVVESRSFLGPIERLRLRVPDWRGVRVVAPAPPFGGDTMVIEAVRSQHQARSFPLEPGDEAWVGLRRVHTLAHPGMAFLLVHDGSAAAAAAVEFGARLAEQARARVTLLACAAAGIDECERALQGRLPALESRRSPDGFEEAVRAEVDRGPFDLVVAGAEGALAVETASAALRQGRHHVLIVPAAPPHVSRILICTAAGEPGRRGIHFAGRLARHLAAEVGVLTVVPEPDLAHGAREVAERHLAASARTLAALGISATTLLRTGAAETVIREEAERGDWSMLVAGAPLPAPGSPPGVHGLVARLLRASIRPMIVVRPGGRNE